MKTLLKFALILISLAACKVQPKKANSYGGAFPRASTEVSTINTTSIESQVLDTVCEVNIVQEESVPVMHKPNVLRKVSTKKMAKSAVTVLTKKWAKQRPHKPQSDDGGAIVLLLFAAVLLYGMKVALALTWGDMLLILLIILGVILLFILFWALLAAIGFVDM